MHQKWTLHQIWGHLHSTKQLPNQLHQLTGNCASLHPALIYDAKPCSECRVLDNFPYGSLASQCHWHFNEIYKLITCTKFQPCSTCDDDDDSWWQWCSLEVRILCNEIKDHDMIIMMMLVTAMVWMTIIMMVMTKMMMMMTVMLIGSEDLV